MLNELVELEDTKQLHHIKNYNLLSHKQYQQIINNWNDTDKDYPSDKTIQALFEEQVARTPNNIAIVYEETKLTYRQLNERANQLANYLREAYEISPDTLIALCLDRSEHMLIAILGVLKAGGAYVPMDSSYPDERISYILEDTSSKLVLTNEVHKQRLDSLAITTTSQVTILAIDDQQVQVLLASHLASNPTTSTTSNNLAYVIYTSGTTGNPKGVMIEHRGVVNTVLSLNGVYDFSKGNKVTAFTSYVFDVSVSEFFTVLFRSGVLYLLGEKVRTDALLISKYIIDNGINYLYLPPVLLSILPRIKYETLHGIIYAGEPCDIDTGTYWSSNYKLYNYYGPTEITIYASSKQIIDGDTNLIGSAISNAKCYVLDTNLTPLPIGAIGELYIGGAGLARGYLNRPDLTAEKFIVNPFQSTAEKKLEKNARLYKTGDLVRWLADGNLEYIGRNDFQVKIRGYRIELEEIESVLSSYEGITQSVVLAKEQQGVGELGSKYLAGYYVSESKLNEEAILNYLQARLLEYMIPAILVHLERLPLTINGKLDRKSLPDPEFTNIETYVTPRNELENQVCRVLAEVLGLPEDKVSIHDDFFRLGGDSIISIQLVSRLRQRLGLNVTVKDIFGYKTIERLYDNVLSKGQGSTQGDLRSEQGILSGEVPLLPVQQWFFKHNFITPNHWNQSFLLRTESLYLDKLQLSITKLVQHHDSFRLRYRKAKDSTTYLQYYNTNSSVEELKILDINKLDIKQGSKEFNSKLQEVLTSWQSNFDLEHGPTYSIGYIFGYEDGSSRIYFALHHLIVDAVSWRIIAEDLRNLYHAKDLGSKGGGYRQWVNAVREYATTHESEKTYWSNILSDYDSNNNHLNKLIASEDTYSYASLQLNKEQTGKLLRDSNRAYNTQVNDILLTALGYSLAEITDNKINYIVLEGHGREEIDSNIDITRTVGWFTTIYPIRLEISEELGNSLKTVKENLRQVPNKGIGYGTVIGYQSDLPRISFNYLGQFDKQGATTDKDLWNIISENSGISMHPANQDNNIVNINGLVVDGKLKFSIASKLGANITNKLADLFQQKLEDIISYTVKQTRSYLTVSDIDNVISQEYLDRLQEHREIEGVYLANSLQQGFIYHTLNQGDVDDAYRVQIIWQYNNQLAINKLKEVWGYAQAKFSSLRLRLEWAEELIQIIDKEGNLDWRYIDLSEEQDFTIQEFTIKQIQEEDRLEVYDLQQGNLFRVYLIKQREDLYTCIFSNHHAILDGWSNSILLGYIHDTYLKLQDKEIILLEIEQSYQEAQKYIQKHQEDNKDYWNKYISQIEERSDLSGLLLSSSKQKQLRISEHKHILYPVEQVLTITGNLYDNLKKFSQEEGVTLNAILQYVWHKVLSIYGNSNQTVVGTTVSGRNLPIDDIESSVGLYINTLPLIVEHQNKTITSVIESIKAIQSDINEINSRSDISLVKLQKGGERLFDSLFVYENYPNPANEEQQSRIKIRFTGSVEKLDYPLAVIAYEINNQLTFMIKYAGELFSNDSIEQLLLIAKSLLEQIVSNPYQEVQNLSYLDQKQYQQIINNWNDTDKTYPSDKTIQALFEEQAARTPNNIAIVYEETKLTYRQLNERANQLANYLRETYQISPDTLIALCLDRSEHMLIAILAVLKAGGAYVPKQIKIVGQRLGLTDSSIEKLKAYINSSNRVQKPKTKESAIGDHWYNDEDMHLYGRRLEKYGVDFNSQFSNMLTEDGIKTLPSIESLIENHPRYISYNIGGSAVRDNSGMHWVAIVLVKREERITILYKDPKGDWNNSPEAVESLFKEHYKDKVDFIKHPRAEQEDDSSCGPMTINNLEIMALKVKEANDEGKDGIAELIGLFKGESEGIAFTTQDQVPSVRISHALQNKSNGKTNLQQDTNIDDLRTIITKLKLIDNDISMKDGKKFNLVTIKGDGNCFYSAVADQLRRLDITIKNNETNNQTEAYYTAQDLRTLTIDYITNNREQEFAKDLTERLQVQNTYLLNDVLNDDLPSNKDTIDRYIERYSKEGIRADSAIIEILAQALNTTLIIYYQDGMPETYNAPQDTGPSVKKVINLQYTGNQYNSLVDVDIEDSISKKKKKIESYVHKIDEYYDKLTLKDWGIDKLKNWSMEHKGQLSKNFGDSTESGEKICEAIAVMDRANELATGGHRLRDTQKAAVLTFMQTNTKGHISQINTGEGKTTIISVIAALKVMQ
ncbi:MAG: amino acid adenylation domain-containing protein [Rickettsiaceae bacterium]|nr:amino acid adenylation domain-containing protein [Rickettsiaceae bacterium]